MKISSKTIAALLSLNLIATTAAVGLLSPEAKIAEAAKARSLNAHPAEYSCFGDEDFTLYFKGKCDYDSLTERMSLKVNENDRCVNSGSEEVMLLVGK